MVIVGKENLPTRSYEIRIRLSGLTLFPAATWNVDKHSWKAFMLNVVRKRSFNHLDINGRIYNKNVVKGCAREQGTKQLELNKSLTSSSSSSSSSIFHQRQIASLCYVDFFFFTLVSRVFCVCVIVVFRLVGCIFS